MCDNVEIWCYITFLDPYLCSHGVLDCRNSQIMCTHYCQYSLYHSRFKYFSLQLEDLSLFLLTKMSQGHLVMKMSPRECILVNDLMREYRCNDSNGGDSCISYWIFQACMGVSSTIMYIWLLLNKIFPFVANSAKFLYVLAVFYLCSSWFSCSLSSKKLIIELFLSCILHWNQNRAILDFSCKFCLRFLGSVVCVSQRPSSICW